MVSIKNKTDKYLSLYTKTDKYLPLLYKTIKKALTTGFFHLFSANIFLQIVGFGMQIFLVRILDVSDIGRIKILQSFMSLIFIFSGQGINAAVLKLCSENIEESEREKIFINAVKINMLTGVAGIFIVYIMSIAGFISSDAIIIKIMKLYIIVIPFNILTDLGIAYLQAIKKIKIMSKLQISIKLVTILTVIMMSYWMKLDGYVLGMICTSIIGFIIFLVLFKKELKIFKKIKLEKKYIVKLFNIGKFGFLGNFTSQISASTDILILSYLVKDVQAIGFYSIAQIIVTTLRIAPLTLNQIMVPYVSEASSNKEKLKKIMTKYSSYNILITCALCIGSYFIVPVLISLLFGHTYLASVEYFKILLIGLIFWSLYSIKGIILWGVGKVNRNFYFGAIMVPISLLITYFCIKYFGVVGAAYGSTLSYATGCLLINIFFNKEKILAKLE